MQSCVFPSACAKSSCLANVQQMDMMIVAHVSCVSAMVLDLITLMRHATGVLACFHVVTGALEKILSRRRGGGGVGEVAYRP